MIAELKMYLFLPPATKLGQGNIFRSVCQEFCSQEGWYPSMALQQVSKRGVVSQHAMQVSRPTPGGGGGLREIWTGGGSPGPHPRGKLRGIWPGGEVSRPTPGGGGS